VAWVALVIAGLAAACRRPEHRVTSDDGRCSVSMPGEPTPDLFSVTLEDGTVLKQQSWSVGHVGAPDTVAPRGNTAYVLRRVTAPAGTRAQGTRVVDMAGRRLVAALVSHRHVSPRVDALPGSPAPAVEVRAGNGQTTSVVRLHAVPDGYCEVAIFGARSEDAVKAYFATAAIRP
jgi:hypothetical protein